MRVYDGGKCVELSVGAAVSAYEVGSDESGYYDSAGESAAVYAGEASGADLAESRWAECGGASGDLAE